MKKWAIPALMILFAACKGGSKPGETQDTTTQQVVAETKVASGLSDAFNVSFESILTNYYALRDALVADDLDGANKSAEQLILSADKLSLDELKASDTADVIIPTAKSYTSGIASESKGLQGEADIEAKRKSFQMISANIFDLARTVRYNKEKIYLLNCPMAFNNTGADWLSNSTEIKNPYFGKKMLTCGAVKDSVVIR